MIMIHETGFKASIFNGSWNHIPFSSFLLYSSEFKEPKGLTFSSLSLVGLIVNYALVGQNDFLFVQSGRLSPSFVVHLATWKIVPHLQL